MQKLNLKSKPPFNVKLRELANIPVDWYSIDPNIIHQFNK